MINQEEYEILKSLDNRLKWISRDKNGDIFSFEEKPYKDVVGWLVESIWKDGCYFEHDYVVKVKLFQFIQWEDGEPHSIAELIEEYDKNQAYEIFNRQFESLYEESEETELKKNKEWVFIELGKLFPDHTEMYDCPDDITVMKCELLNKVYDILAQLDEPEVLSQEWMKDNQLMKISPEGVVYYVPVENLQNLLVPKQELPVVPSWFDEWWKDVTKGGGNLFHNIERFYDELFSSGTREMYNYISGPDNKKKLLDIIVNELDYVVEEEQKYYAKIKGHELVNDSEDGYWNVDRKELYIDNIWHDNSGYKTTKLTKDEWENLGINEDNADFVKVEEVE